MSIICTVCLGKLNICGRNVSALNCGHLFHKECLEPWLATQLSCPYCRSEVTKNKIVKNVYPCKNEDVGYKGSCAETKSILKFYKNSTKKFRDMLVNRIETVEKQNSKLSDEKDSLNEENLRLKAEIAKIKSQVKKSKSTFKSAENISIDVAVIGTMLNKKKVAHAILVSEVLGQFKVFKPEVKAIEERVEYLIEQKRMKRDDQNRNHYIYLA